MNKTIRFKKKVLHNSRWLCKIFCSDLYNVIITFTGACTAGRVYMVCGGGGDGGQQATQAGQPKSLVGRGLLEDEKNVG
jgi:hypothetical protein